MGVDAADFDQDGWQDLFVSNVDQEMYSVYRNNRDETFDDVAGPLGVAAVTRLMSGWGAKFFDYDNDGNTDLFIANGHPDEKIEEHSTHVRYQGAVACLPQRRQVPSQHERIRRPGILRQLCCPRHGPRRLQ